MLSFFYVWARKERYINRRVYHVFPCLCLRLTSRSRDKSLTYSLTYVPVHLNTDYPSTPPPHELHKPKTKGSNGTRTRRQVQGGRRRELAGCGECAEDVPDEECEGGVAGVFLFPPFFLPSFVLLSGEDGVLCNAEDLRAGHAHAGTHVLF